MVRLQREKWFNADGQSRIRKRAHSQNRTSSQLIRLVVMLVMILMLMRYASDPNVYRQAFRQLGVPMNASDQSQERLQKTNVDPANQLGNGPENKAFMRESDSILLRSIWDYVLVEAPDHVVDLLSRRAFANRHFNPTDDMHAIEGLKRWTEQVQTNVESWQQNDDPLAPSDSNSLVDFQSDWSLFRQWLVQSPNEPSPFEPEEWKVILDALDHRLLGNIEDASPWNSKERVAFLRSCQRARQAKYVESVSGPIVQPVLLADQADIYRGQWIRITGSLASEIESLHETDQDFGDFDYQRIWLRPSDSSPQPIAIYLMQPLPAVPEESADLEIFGFFVKRLAYSSQRGIDVAPGLIAAGARWQNPTNQLASQIVPIRKPMPRWAPPNAKRDARNAIEDLIEKPLRALHQTEILQRWNAADITSVDPEVLQVLFQLNRASDALRSDSSPSNEKAADTKIDWIREYGRVTRVEAIALPREAIEWYEKSTIYRVTLAVPSDQHESNGVIICSHVPRHWLATKPQQQTRHPSFAINQWVQVQGIRISDESANSMVLADRLEWTWSPGDLTFPANPPISENWKILGELGWDLSQIDLLQSLQKKPLQAAENRGFYSLMNLIDSSSSNAESIFHDRAASLPDLLAHPNENTLRETTTRLRIIRISRVLVKDDPWQKALGSDSYFEVDGIADLGKLRIEVKFDPALQQPPLVFEGEFPITLVAKQLPDFLMASLTNETGKGQIDPNSNVWYPRIDVNASGLFYRLWSYATTQTNRQVAGQRQFGPLVFATQFQRIEDAKQTIRQVRNQIDWFNALLILIASVMGLALWRWQVSKKRIRYGRPSR